MYLGIIDSGYGGLAFLSGIYNEDNKYCIVMDKQYFPYGNKSKLFLFLRTLYLCDYLFMHGVDKIILACNTLSLVVLDDIKKIYKDKVEGVFSLFETLNIDDKTLFLGTLNATKAFSEKYNAKSIISDDLILKIQNNEVLNTSLLQIEEYLNDYDKILFGCTHFIKIKKDLKASPKFYFQDDLYNAKYVDK